MAGSQMHTVATLSYVHNMNFLLYIYGVTYESVTLDNVYWIF